MSAYVEPSRVRLDLDNDAFGPMALGLSEDEYSQLLTSYIEEESERVEELTGETWEATVPGAVKRAVIRLVRARFLERQTDGLNSENTGDSASYNYRSPGEIREEVAEALDEAGYSDNLGDLSVPDVRGLR